MTLKPKPKTSRLEVLIKLGLFAGPILLIVLIGGWFLSQYEVAVLHPQGEIARQQRDLIIFTVLLGLVVIIPVFVMLAIFAWRFRDSNKKAKYRPNWSSNKFLELIWWGIPCILIIILGVITWRTSHDLDPYKKIDSPETPIEVQVVALQWKWLFIYPEQGIATVNMLQFPEKTPLNLTLTADAPMNAFWVPSLGSQVYAMSGMSTKLHLIADKVGDYKGYSTNISGEGYADMKFTARASTRSDFDAWVGDIKKQSKGLDMAYYSELAKADTPKVSSYYTLKDTGLYDRIVMKYMSHPQSKQDDTHNEGSHDRHNMMEME